MKTTILQLKSLVAQASTTGNLPSLKEAQTLIDTFITKAKRDVSGEARDPKGKWTKGGWTTGYYWDTSSEQWLDHNDKPMPLKHTNRLKQLAAQGNPVPKSLIGVKLNPDTNAASVAIGYMWNRSDGTVATKPKYVQNKTVEAASYKAKFDALSHFNTIKKALDKVAYTDAMNGKPAAAVVVCLSATAQRVGATGNATGGNPTYGLTTLEARHVKVRGDAVTFDYIGKGGKRYKQTHINSKMASVIRAFLIDKQGNDKKPGDPLFKVTDDTVRTYMRDNGGKLARESKMGAHMYRYWWATTIALGVLQHEPVPTIPRTAARLKNKACEAAAKFLNNEPEQCYDTYINPMVWKDWGEDIAPAAPARSKAASIPSPAKADLLMEEELNAYIFPDYGDMAVIATVEQLLPDVEDGDHEDYLRTIGKADSGTKAKRDVSGERRGSDGRWATGGGDPGNAGYGQASRDFLKRKGIMDPTDVDAARDGIDITFGSNLTAEGWDFPEMSKGEIKEHHDAIQEAGWVQSHNVARDDVNIITYTKDGAKLMVCDQLEGSDDLYSQTAKFFAAPKKAKAADVE